MREKFTPGLIGWLFCRFRYIDDVLKKITAQEFAAVVNLGAGMDCRAYYIPSLQNIKYFEVDCPSVIKKKQEKLKHLLGKLPDRVVFVPIDFETQSLDLELQKAGLNLNSKTLFIMEGVTQYISEEANISILKYVAQATPKSQIVFSYILKSFIDGKNIHKGIKVMYQYMRKNNNPLWIYGIEPTELGDLLAKYSLALVEDIGSEEVKERYLQLANQELKVFEIERIALAEVTRS